MACFLLPLLTLSVLLLARLGYLEFDIMTTTLIDTSEIRLLILDNIILGPRLKLGFQTFHPSFNNILVWVFLIIVSLFLCVLAVKCSFSCIDTFYKGYQHKRSNRDCLNIAFVMLRTTLFIFLIVQFFSMCIRLWTFSVSCEIISTMLPLSMDFKKLYISGMITPKKLMWDKLQLNYECCGVNNYTDWTNISVNTFPNSCCKLHAINSGNIPCGIDDINQAGCAKHFASHISHYVRHDILFFLVPTLSLMLSVSLLFFGSTWLSNIACKNGSKTNKNKDSILLPDTKDKVFEEPREIDCGDDDDDVNKEQEESKSIDSRVTAYYSLSGYEAEDV